MRISDWSSDVCSSDLVSSQWPPSACTASILAGAVVAGITAVNDSPSRRATHASEIAVLPDEASTTAWPGRSRPLRSEEHTSELQSLMRTPYAGFCLKKKKKHTNLPIRNLVKDVLLTD